MILSFEENSMYLPEFVLFGDFSSLCSEVCTYVLVLIRGVRTFFLNKKKCILNSFWKVKQWIWYSHSSTISTQYTTISADMYYLGTEEGLKLYIWISLYISSIILRMEWQKTCSLDVLPFIKSIHIFIYIFLLLGSFFLANL